MAATQSPQEPLEKLPLLLNSVLIQMGSVFRESARGQPKALGAAKAKMHQAIPKANREFHEALDVVEIELLKAKAVMERDLRLIRAKRAEREKAVMASRLASARDISNGHTGPATTAAVDAQSKEAQVNTKTTQDMEAEDVVMDDESSKPPGPGASNVSETSGELAEVRSDQAVDKTSQNDGTDIELAKMDSLPPKEVDDHDTTQGASTENTEVEVQNSLFDHELDSMFNDAISDEHGKGSVNFDLDFSTDANNPQDLLATNPFDELASNSHDFNALNTSSNEDINTLLPGLDNYVNADADGNSRDDFGMLNITSAGPGFEMSNMTDNALNTKTTLDMAAENAAPPPPSTFDDMFFGTSGDMDMGDGMGVDEEIGDFDDFDDVWG